VRLYSQFPAGARFRYERQLYLENGGEIFPNLYKRALEFSIINLYLIDNKRMHILVDEKNHDD
jgi:hypothetical protein